MVNRLGSAALTAGQNNVAFLSFFALGKYVYMYIYIEIYIIVDWFGSIICHHLLDWYYRLEECLDILVSNERLPEAALFARSYLPLQVSRYSFDLFYRRRFILITSEFIECSGIRRLFKCYKRKDMFIHAEFELLKVSHAKN